MPTFGSSSPDITQEERSRLRRAKKAFEEFVDAVKSNHSDLPVLEGLVTAYEPLQSVLDEVIEAPPDTPNKRADLVDWYMAQRSLLLYFCLNTIHDSLTGEYALRLQFGEELGEVNASSLQSLLNELVASSNAARITAIAQLRLELSGPAPDRNVVSYHNMTATALVNLIDTARLSCQQHGTACILQDGVYRICPSEWVYEWSVVRDEKFEATRLMPAGHGTQLFASRAVQDFSTRAIEKTGLDDAASLYRRAVCRKAWSVPRSGTEGGQDTAIFTWTFPNSMVERTPSLADAESGLVTALEDWSGGRQAR